MKNEDFYQRVFDLVAQIPVGKVTTFGAIGRHLGLASSARTVGWALNTLKGSQNLPAHRVVNRNGELTGRIHFETPGLMRELLESEGVELIGERVNMEKHFWSPEEKENKSK